MKQALFGLLLLSPLAGRADEVHLKGGGKVAGVLVEHTAKAVVIDVGVGRVTLAATRVERIVAAPSHLAEYRRRSSELAAEDAGAWLRLALWASDHSLHTQAREAFGRVLALEPDNPTAQRALGNVLLGERWVTPEESYRARGYVFFEGTWITPEERDEFVRQASARASAAAAERARAEAEARAREAEARARVAEAEARRAESQAEGYPLAWAVAGGGCCFARTGQPVRSAFLPTPPVPPPLATPPSGPPAGRSRLVTRHAEDRHQR